MPLYRVPIPAGLERKDASTALPPDRAAVLQRMDLIRWPGRARRGPGQSRAQITPSTSTLIGGVVLRARNCNRVVVDGSTAGTWRATSGLGGTLTGIPCAGPLPEANDGAESENGLTAAPGGGWTGLGVAGAATGCPPAITECLASCPPGPLAAGSEYVYFDDVESPTGCSGCSVNAVFNDGPAGSGSCVDDSLNLCRKTISSADSIFAGAKNC